MRTPSTLITFSLLSLALVACSRVKPAPSETKTTTDVIVTSPELGSLVESPLSVEGKARGTWFFEASLPVEITDASGNVIAVAPASADGEWMTTEYVDFSVTIPFSTAEKSGFLVIKKNNPSGLPEHDAMVKIPVHF